MDIEKIIRGYIPQIVHMSLATCADNKPWVCEVHFAFDDDLNLYFRSSPARRHSQEIAKNPHVAGNIVTQHFLNQTVRGVYYEGMAKKLSPDDEQMTAYQALSQRLGMGEELIEEAKKPDGPQLYKITVDTFYVFDAYKTPAGKHELPWNKKK